MKGFLVVALVTVAIAAAPLVVSTRHPIRSCR